MRYTKNIMDSTHGSIPVTDIESKIIDHPLFQRLRNIRQLGTTHLVFPGALHSRFVHSIGVMHIAGQYYEALMREFPKTENYFKLMQLVRLSALLHDVGHGPFSHTFESTFGDIKVRDIKENEISFNFEHLKPDISENFLSSKLSHEHISISIIYRIIQDISPKDLLFEARNICNFINNEISPSNKMKFLVASICNQKGDIDSFLSCISSVISGEFDADRMDYLQRDSLHCGVRLAGIDTGHIFDSVKIVEVDGKYRILVNQNCIASLEQMLISRKFMFDQVYHHKLSCVFDWMLEQIFEYLKIEKHIKFIENYNGYIVQSDGYIISKIKDCLQSGKLDDSMERVFTAFLTRTKPNNLTATKVDDDSPIDVEKFKKDYSTKIIVDKNLKILTKLDYRNPKRLYLVPMDGYHSYQYLEKLMEITKEGFYQNKKKLLIAFDYLDTEEFIAKLDLQKEIFLPASNSAA